MKRTLLLFLSIAPAAYAQGPLDPPPGGPQPSMKTLGQVEPRIDLCNAPASHVTTTSAQEQYVIREPGSYYLSRNLTAGGVSDGVPEKPSLILISAPGVTLDLNGYGLYAQQPADPAAPDPFFAVYIGSDSACVHGGVISGFRIGVGSFNRAEGVVVRDLRVSDCLAGVDGGPNSIISQCTVSGGLTAIEGGVISHCSVRGMTSSNGITGIVGKNVRYCAVEGLSGSNVWGIAARFVADCTVVDLTSDSRDALGVLASVATRCLVDGIEGNDEAWGVRSGFGSPGDDPLSLSSECVVRDVSAGRAAIAFASQNGGGTRFEDCVAEGVSVAGGGTGAVGFDIFGESVVEGCRVSDANVGFEMQMGSVVRNSDAAGCTTGFLVLGAAGVEGCSATGNRIGFELGDGSVLRGCTANGNVSDGTATGTGFLVAGNRNRLIGCQADRNDWNFSITGGSNHLESCVAIATAIPLGIGFVSSGSNNTVIRCEAKDCGINFSMVASTKAGPVINDPVDATNPFSNFSN